MKSMIVGMLAETPVHIGAGRSSGFVDLPVARESVTGYPMIPGSGLKGAFRELARRNGLDVDTIFGKQENAGHLLVSDARLLLLPVRSLTGHFKWATCPYILERLMRDVVRTGSGNERRTIGRVDGPKNGSVFSNGSTTGGSGKLFLEEREFVVKGGVEEEIITAVANMTPHDAVRERIRDQLVILSDDDFTWFAQYGLSVNARNVLDDEKKTSKNLWYEETIPMDSLFYTVLFERGAGAMGSFADMFSESPFIQVGGNETVGHGWFALKVVGREG